MCSVQRASLTADNEKFFVYEEKKVGRIDSRFVFAKVLHWRKKRLNVSVDFSCDALKNNEWT